MCRIDLFLLDPCDARCELYHAAYSFIISSRHPTKIYQSLPKRELMPFHFTTLSPRSTHVRVIFRNRRTHVCTARRNEKRSCVVVSNKREKKICKTLSSNFCESAYQRRGLPITSLLRLSLHCAINARSHLNLCSYDMNIKKRNKERLKKKKHHYNRY